jgi:hypothetical protein
VAQRAGAVKVAETAVGAEVPREVPRAAHMAVGGKAVTRAVP